jgi:hypothetical protein
VPPHVQNTNVQTFAEIVVVVTRAMVERRQTDVRI